MLQNCFHLCFLCFENSIFLPFSIQLYRFQNWESIQMYRVGPLPTTHTQPPSSITPSHCSWCYCHSPASISPTSWDPTIPPALAFALKPRDHYKHHSPVLGRRPNARKARFTSFPPPPYVSWYCLQQAEFHCEALFQSKSICLILSPAHNLH